MTCLITQVKCETTHYALWVVSIVSVAFTGFEYRLPQRQLGERLREGSLRAL
jgi:hypothetical protein